MRNLSPAAMNHLISREEAAAMTAFFRESKDDLLAAPYRNSNILCNSETFPLEVIAALTATPGCAGIRIYNGMQEDLTVHSILVAVDGAGNDILPGGNSTASLADDDPIIVEEGKRCPPACPEGLL